MMLSGGIGLVLNSFLGSKSSRGIDLMACDAGVCSEMSRTMFVLSSCCLRERDRRFREGSSRKGSVQSRCLTSPLHDVPSSYSATTSARHSLWLQTTYSS